MAVAAKISVEEYLNTCYRPDCDYVDGEVLDRNLGEQSHGRLQLNIGVWLKSRERQFRFRVLPEVRLQVRNDRFRVPDIMLVPPEAAGEAIVRTPPLLCIEVLSPCDTLARIHRRAQEYFAMGVPVCWIIDPLSGQAWTATPAGIEETTGGVLRAGDIEMPLNGVLE
jgi:Uma2 family endonuclease